MYIETFDCNIYTHSFETYEVHDFPSDKIQLRAIRFSLGVHKFTPITGPHREMGWVSRSDHKSFYVSVSLARFRNKLMSIMQDLQKTYQLNNSHPTWKFWASTLIMSLYHMNE